MNNLPLIKFNLKLPKLTSNEKRVLDFLVEAGELIAPLYLEQEKEAKEVNREEFKKAAKKDSGLLSPYTVIEKINNKLVATPYHVKYAYHLKPIAEKLNQASKITTNREFKRFLQLQAKALLDGSYEEANAAWVGMKPYVLDVAIGPFEHLDDKLFYGKASYQCWIGTLDKEGTERLNNYKSIVLSAKRKALVPNKRIDNLGRVKAEVVDVVLFSGHMARTKFVGVNLPMNPKFIEKYGSEITLFNQPNDQRMQEQIIPTFNRIFSKGFKEGFSFEDLRRGNLRYIAMHELAHSFLYYRNAEENLMDLFQPIFELAATVLGFRMAGSLLLKDRITEKQLESMIIAALCRGFYLIEHQKTNQSMINYIVGWSILINFILKSGALKQVKGMAIPNFTKIFVAIHELSEILETLLSAGSRKEAEIFINKYSQFNNIR